MSAGRLTSVCMSHHTVLWQSLDLLLLWCLLIAEQVTDANSVHHERPKLRFRHSPELGRRFQLIKSKTCWRKEHSYQTPHTVQASGCPIRTGCTLMRTATSCERNLVQAASYLWLFSTERHPEQSKFWLFSTRTCSLYFFKKKSFQSRGLK